MVHDFSQTSTLLGVRNEHARDDVTAFCAIMLEPSAIHEIWKSQLTGCEARRVLHHTLLDLRVQLRHTLVIEWHLATDQNVKDDTKTPDVDLGARVLSGLQQFRGSEIETATECLQKTPGREEIAETEVNDLDVTRLADEYVLDLQVSMHDAVAVAVIQSAGDLTSEFSRLFFLQFTMGYDVVQHLTAVDILEEHVPMIRSPDHVAHPADVWMAHQADNGGLSRCPDLLRAVCPLRFPAVAMFLGRESRYDLDGNLLE